MIVTYKPEHDPSQGWEKEFYPLRIKANRAEMIEKRYGQRFTTWVKEVQSGEARARRVLVWHLLSLDHPTFRMEDVPEFAFGELEVDYSLDDLQKLRKEMAESSANDADKEEILEQIDLEIATKLIKTTDELTSEDLGKAEGRSETGSSSSSVSSPTTSAGHPTP